MRFARRPARARQILSRPFVRTGLARPNRILLTFDDGPHPTHTPTVLDQLRTAGASGAFFLVGKRVADSPGLPAAIVGAGHLIGNHTFSHPKLGWWDRAGAYAEVARCQEMIPAGARWFRPPFGRVTPGLWLAARRLGLGVVNWTLDANDWQCRTPADAAACAAELLDRVRPGDTVLLHDNHPWIGPVLDVVLPGLLARGLIGPERMS